MNICYIRTSTQEQTPQLQIADIHKVYPVADMKYYEEKQSAWKENAKRPVFDEIKALIKKGDVQNFFVWDLDRIYRNRLRLKEFFELCKAYGVKIHSVNQTWLNELNKIPMPFNDMMMDLLINLFGWIGEQESGKKSARVKMAVVRSSKGTYSYKNNKWGRKAYPKQTTTRILELAALGASIREIANQITVFDKNRNEKKIGKSTVQKILAENPR